MFFEELLLAQAEIRAYTVPDAFNQHPKPIVYQGRTQSVDYAPERAPKAKAPADRGVGALIVLQNGIRSGTCEDV